ncbi:gfo/Idh/MocA family oxidoreductase [Bacillus lacus]|uniref:Gfo/Idh/MocA family oxidoreductase n=1 Tax=Metabacillus lacus TaxID=1983721 RepID=A0A7X2J273_9BACI|nr:Gfo/Idh/MocA family oxidoreductase [Metabacillus lacus]MRX73889.1 gfo/Idh/MocA family oxidoreductase [Metabacillus lacus]
MEKLKIGLIGAGGIAQSRHIPALLALSDQVSIAAVSDINEETARTVADRFSIPGIYADYRDMLLVVDAVVVCTPNKFHSEIAIAALSEGKHVFCEKPMALSTDEAQLMLEAAKKAEKILAIGYHYRFTKEAQAAKTLIEAGEIGSPLVARVSALRRRKVPGWGVFTNKELQGGGSLIDWGCHFLDLSLWLLGNPQPAEVSGKAYNSLSKMPGQVNLWGGFDHENFEVDDHVTAYIKFKNGATMLFETSWAANIQEDITTVSISGETGGIDLFPFVLNQAKYGMLLNTSPEWLPGEDDPGIPQMKNFIYSCLGLQEPVVKPEQALQVSGIIDAVYASDLSRESITLAKKEDI